MVTPEKKGLSLCARNLWTCKVNLQSEPSFFLRWESLVKLWTWGLCCTFKHLKQGQKGFFFLVDLVGRFLLSEITCNCVIQFTWVVSDYSMRGVKMLSKSLPPNNKQRWQTRIVTDRERAAATLLSFYSYSDSKLIWRLWNNWQIGLVVMMFCIGIRIQNQKSISILLLVWGLR